MTCTYPSCDSPNVSSTPDCSHGAGASCATHTSTPPTAQPHQLAYTGFDAATYAGIGVAFIVAGLAIRATHHGRKVLAKAHDLTTHHHHS